MPLLRSLAVAAAAGLTASTAVGCGGGTGGGGGDGRVTGRVVSLDGSQVCVSPDRGATRRCASLGGPEAPAGVDVGECATLEAPATDTASVRVVDEAACAAGDLGD